MLRLFPFPISPLSVRNSKGLHLFTYRLFLYHLLPVVVGKGMFTMGVVSCIVFVLMPALCVHSCLVWLLLLNRLLMCFWWFENLILFNNLNLIMLALVHFASSFQVLVFNYWFKKFVFWTIMCVLYCFLSYGLSQVWSELKSVTKFTF